MSPAEGKVVEALRASLLEAERLRAENERLRAAAREPVAIVAMACRYPGGVESPEDLWELVSQERDVIGGFPDDRGWDLGAVFGPDADPAVRSGVGEGGFLRVAGDFDPAPFGITPRRASVMDPQQRLLLEISWEAFERAGMDPRSVAGERHGVFMGTTGQDYTPHLVDVPEELLAEVGVGSTAAVLSGRLAYVFGLEGPTVTVDTACSGALVALHLACQALRGGECSMALAGGVAVMSSPNRFIGSGRGIGLAVADRCRSFADRATGIAFAEGAGVVLLERLSAAREHGHPVLAVIRGSAIGQEGATSGMSTSSGPAQQRLIRRALAGAGLRPDEVDAVEGQGTGGLLSDAIEAQALAAVYGRDRSPDRPLLLGSVKSNLGHSQAASGLAGVIKMVSAMQHGVLPRSLHSEAPSPHIAWDTGRISLLKTATDWPATRRPRRVGVSAFGFGGSNAHVILEQAPADDPVSLSSATDASAADDSVVDDSVVDSAATEAPAANDRMLFWPVSGCDPDALRAQAGRLLAHLAERPGLRPADVGLSLGTSRAALSHRGVVVGERRQDLVDGLAALAAGEPTSRVATAVVGRRYRLGILLTGYSLAPDIEKRLSEAFPVFADAYETLCAQLDTHLDPQSEARMGLPVRTFAVQMALLGLVMSWGVRPHTIRGYGIGRIAAEHANGKLSLTDACTVLTGRLDPEPEPSEVADEVRASAKPGTVHLEIGGHEVADLLADAGSPAVAMLRPDTEEATAVASALAHLHAHGSAVDWPAVFAGTGARRVDLPTYAFQRARYWRAAFSLDMSKVRRSQ